MRRENDYYPTPRWATAHLLSSLPFAIAAPWVEPCVGTRDIADVVWQQCAAGITGDIDKRMAADVHGDASDPDTWEAFEELIGMPPAWCITNPPFNQASRILPLAMERCTMGVIALLRLSYLEPCANRGPWLEQHQDRLSILFLPKRVSFTGDGQTDNVATAWFIWGKDRRLTEPFVYPVVDQQLALEVSP
jgi:hypothetical protein